METTIVYWGYIGIMENKMETTVVYWGYIGIMENQMETTIVYWGYIIGMMANTMETTIHQSLNMTSFMVPTTGHHVHVCIYTQ